MLSVTAAKADKDSPCKTEGDNCSAPVSMVAHVYNPDSQEVEAGRLPQTEANLNYTVNATQSNTKGGGPREMTQWIRMLAAQS